MILTALPNYFIVRIEIEKQKERKEKIGSLYLHFNEVQMQRNMQHGEIIAIGSIAANNFPKAKKGNILIFHHFVESEKNLIHSDETYNYYNVTSSVFNGRRNECYAIWNGLEIIPHPDFIFIEPAEKEKEISADEFIDKNTTQVGSLLVFNNWEESRESKEERAARITTEIKNQSRSKHIAHDVKIGLEEKQKEAENITTSLTAKKYVPYKVSASNPSVKIKENVFALNLAGTTELEFMGKDYIVIQSKYCVATA